MTRRSATTTAPAKINLFLRVLHRREDGFHELETLFQAISIADRVRVTLDDGDADGGVPTLGVVGADVGPDEENLAFRAAAAFQTRFEIVGAIHVDLEKVVPAGGGLGGGSSDAAAVLRCLSALTGQGTDEALADIALGLGSDVPFFLTRTGLALARGRGERLVPLPALPPRPLVVVMPDVHVSTAGAYGAIAESRANTGVPTARALAVQDLSSWVAIDALSENDFTAPVTHAHAAVASGQKALRSLVSGPVLLSGSGAASFGFARDEAEAETAVRKLSEGQRLRAVACATLVGSPPIEIAEPS